jgi:DNA-binding FadR family transcriptional regulator
MAMTAAQRMARLRARQRAAGLASLSIVVPKDDVDAFVRLASRRRRAQAGRGIVPATAVRWPRKLRDVRATRVSAADIRALRELLEVTAVTLACRRMNDARARRLRSQVQREAGLAGDATSVELQRLHLLIAELAGDDALRLLLRIALQLTDERSAFAEAPLAKREQLVARIKRLHTGIAEALLDRNEGLAVRRMRRYLSGLGDWLE